MKKQIVLVILGILVAVFSCNQGNKKNDTAATNSYPPKEDSLFDLAHRFFKPLPAVAADTSNIISIAKIRLGKILYYDPRLSKTGDISCNTCHNLNAFGVDNEVVSTGVDFKPGNRNSPTVFNAALHNMQFWDGRAKNVEEQAGMPILNPVEMAIPHKGFLINRLKTIQLYQDLFKAAFPGEAKPLTYENLQKAIGAFERTLLSPSRFDAYMLGNREAITDTEKKGLSVFLSAGCATCHNGVGIGGASLQRFGLVTDYRTLTNSKIKDEGVKKLTKSEVDKDKFKVAGLRNVEGTYPYFHDGSIATVDTAIKIMAKVQLNKNLSEAEITQVVAFLKTLTGDIAADAKTIPLELVKK